MGPGAVLGKGSNDRRSHDKCAGRDCRGKADLQIDIMIEYSIDDLVRIVTALLRTTDVLHFKDSDEDADPAMTEDIAAK